MKIYCEVFILFYSVKLNYSELVNHGQHVPKRGRQIAIKFRSIRKTGSIVMFKRYGKMIVFIDLCLWVFNFLYSHLIKKWQVLDCECWIFSYGYFVTGYVLDL